MNTLHRNLLVFAVAVVMSGCTTTGSETANAQPSATGERIWVEADTSTPEGRRVLDAELSGARSRVLPAMVAAGHEGTQDADSRPAARPVAVPLATWSGPKLAIEFRDTPLKDVVAAVGTGMKVNVVVPDGLDQQITVNFPQIDPLLGLDMLLRRHGFRVNFDNSVLSVVPLEKETRTFRLRSNRSFDADKLVKPLLTDGAMLVADSLRHTFTVTDTPEKIDLVDKFVRSADAREPQVLIEALLVEVRRDREDSHGSRVEAGSLVLDSFQGQVTSTLPATAPVGEVPFSFGVTRSRDMVALLLSGREARTRFNVLSNPLVAAASGEKAEIDVVQRVPYIKSTNTINIGSGTAATNSSSEVSFEDVGVKLTVTPEVGGDGIVKLIVIPDVRELVGFSVGTPVIDTRKVTTSVFVRDGETLVIGGLLKTGRHHTTEKVPVLGDIPIIGDLFFTHDLQTEERVELLCFVTPHLMGTANGEDGLFDANKTWLKPGGKFGGVADTINGPFVEGTPGGK